MNSPAPFWCVALVPFLFHHALKELIRLCIHELEPQPRERTRKRTTTLDAIHLKRTPKGSRRSGNKNLMNFQNWQCQW